jgi:NAD(P)-dependent dehydrogenase (short-subunit alcohol dehydrogenase family)
MSTENTMAARRVAFVTGGMGGLGEAISRRLCDAGMTGYCDKWRHAHAVSPLPGAVKLAGLSFCLR